MPTRCPAQWCSIYISNNQKASRQSVTGSWCPGDCSLQPLCPWRTCPGNAASHGHSKGKPWGCGDLGFPVLLETLWDLTSWPKAGKEPGKVTAGRRDLLAQDRAEKQTVQGFGWAPTQLSWPWAPSKKRHQSLIHVAKTGTHMQAWHHQHIELFTHLSLFFAPPYAHLSV